MQIKTDCEAVVFLSSSGHCSLACSYCIINPIAKHEPSLSYQDITCLLHQIGKPTFLACSGKGDFFCGYRREDRLLEKLLAHDVELALDINGVILHEFSELSLEKTEKIKYVNLTMHYRQLVEKGALTVWRDHALLLLERLDKKTEFLLGCILSPSESHLWQEALDYYERELFRRTGKKIVLIKDVHGGFSAEDETRLQEIVVNTGPDMIESTHQEDFTARFSGCSAVLCPAGSTYFRVWNDGQVSGCPNIPELADCGNLKAHTFHPRKDGFLCTVPHYCDCNVIATLGKMRYPEDPSGNRSA